MNNIFTPYHIQIKMKKHIYNKINNTDWLINKKFNDVPFFKWNHKRAAFTNRDAVNYKPKKRKITLELKKVIQNYNHRMRLVFLINMKKMMIINKINSPNK